MIEHVSQIKKRLAKPDYTLDSAVKDLKFMVKSFDTLFRATQNAAEELRELKSWLNAHVEPLDNTMVSG